MNTCIGSERPELRKVDGGVYDRRVKPCTKQWQASSLPHK